MVDLILPFICPHQPDIKVPLRLVTFVIFVFLIGMTFIFILTVVTSLTLNAEFFNPFVAPILTLIIYFWKNWKSSVEAKCLDLKTLIIDVSLQKVKAKKNEQNSGEDRAKVTNSKASRDKIRILKFLCPCLSCIEPPEIKKEVIKLKKLSRPAASNGEKENIIKLYIINSIIYIEHHKVRIYDIQFLQILFTISRNVRILYFELGCASPDIGIKYTWYEISGNLPQISYQKYIVKLLLRQPTLKFT